MIFLKMTVSSSKVHSEFQAVRIYSFEVYTLCTCLKYGNITAKQELKAAKYYTLFNWVVLHFIQSTAIIRSNDRPVYA